MRIFQTILEIVVMHARDIAFTFFITGVVGFIWGVIGLMNEKK